MPAPQKPPQPDLGTSPDPHSPGDPISLAVRPSLSLKAGVVSTGFGEGPAVIVSNILPTFDRPKIPNKSSAIEAEVERLARGFEAAISWLKSKLPPAGQGVDVCESSAITEDEPPTTKSDEDDIFEDTPAANANDPFFIESQLQILEGRSFRGQIERHIRENHYCAEFAIRSVCRDLAEVMSYLPAQNFANDYEQLAGMLLRGIHGMPEVSLANLQEDCVVVADSLTPGQAIDVRRNRHVMGVALRTSESASHVRIILTDSQVPVLTCEQLDHIRDGDQLLINGPEEKVIVNPDEETSVQFRSIRAAITSGGNNTPVHTGEVRTKSGELYSIKGTLNLPKDVRSLLARGVEGIGLYRTECIFLGKPRSNWPDENRQALIYSSVLRAAEGKTVTIRTVDLGAEKWEAAFGKQPGGSDSKLGVRAFRYALEDPDFYRSHLRAILTAQARHGNAQIMFPMINDLGEFRQAKSMLLEEADRLVQQGILETMPDLRVGAMIETASGVLEASKILEEADFASVGSSDLVQSILQVDRDIGAVRHSFLPHHPAVIRALKQTVDAATLARKPITICGEMANHRTYVPLCVGCGLEASSVPSNMVEKIRLKVPWMDKTECRTLAAGVIEARTANDAWALISEFHDKLEDRISAAGSNS